MSGKNGFKLDGTLMYWKTRKNLFCQNWTTLYVCWRLKSQRYKFERFDVSSVHCAIMEKNKLCSWLRKKPLKVFKLVAETAFLNEFKVSRYGRVWFHRWIHEILVRFKIRHCNDSNQYIEFCPVLKTNAYLILVKPKPTFENGPLKCGFCKKSFIMNAPLVS